MFFYIYALIRSISIQTSPILKLCFKSQLRQVEVQTAWNRCNNLATFCIFKCIAFHLLLVFHKHVHNVKFYGKLIQLMPVKWQHCCCQYTVSDKTKTVSLQMLLKHITKKNCCLYCLYVPWIDWIYIERICIYEYAYIKH